MAGGLKKSRQILDGLQSPYIFSDFLGICPYRLCSLLDGGKMLDKLLRTRKKYWTKTLSNFPTTFYARYNCIDLYFGII